jgi:hypothetical protein
VAAGLGDGPTPAAADAAAQKDAEGRALAKALADFPKYLCAAPCLSVPIPHVVASGAGGIAAIAGGGEFSSFGWAKAQLDVQCIPQPGVPIPPQTAPGGGQTAIEAKLRILTHFNELLAIPVPEPEFSVFRAVRDSIKPWLLAEIQTLTANPADAEEFWKRAGDFLVAVGIGVLIEKLIPVVGKALGPIAHILADPTPIGGVDNQTIDTLDVLNPPRCYRITWYRTKWSDEMQWGSVRIKIERIPCPE